MKHKLTFILFLLFVFLFVSCNNRPRRNPNTPPGSPQDTTIQSQQRQPRTNQPRNRNSSPPSSYNNTQSRINTNRGGGLPDNNYEYNCPGWAEIFLAELKRNYIALIKVPEGMLSQEFHDFFDPRKTPLHVCKALDLYCQRYVNYVSQSVQLDQNVLDTLINGGQVQSNVFIKKE